MLSARFVPHNEFHVFDDGQWQFSVAELCLQHDDVTPLSPLTHQYCLRAPGFDQVAFDARDVRQMDRTAAWDPHLRVGQLTRLLSKSFENVDGIIAAIAPFMCPIDASVRFDTSPKPAKPLPTQYA